MPWCRWGLLCFGMTACWTSTPSAAPLCVVQEGLPDPWRPGRGRHGAPGGGPAGRHAPGLAGPSHRQVQYLVDGLEAIGVVCQQAGPCGLRGCGQAAAPHPADQFRPTPLACELCKVAGIGGGDGVPRCWGATPPPASSTPARRSCCARTIPVPPIPRPTWTLSSRPSAR